MLSDTQIETALLDQLTGLSNRMGMEAYLKELPEDIADRGLAVLTLELSRFGNVNDSMGADLGNKIISTVAKRIQKIFPHADRIARTHGDHFCLAFAGQVDVYEQI